MSLGMGLLLGSMFAGISNINRFSSNINGFHNYTLEHELRKQNSLKEEENKLKELEIKIKQFEKYSDEELLDKFNNINPEEEFDVMFEVKGGLGNKILHTEEGKDKIKNTQEFKDLQGEVTRRGLFLSISENQN